MFEPRTDATMPSADRTVAPKRWRGVKGAVAGLIAIAVLGALGYQIHAGAAREQAARDSAEAQRLEVERFRIALGETRATFAALERRLADADRINRRLRDEVLALGSRAGALEALTTRLAAERMETIDEVIDDEVDFLLALADERWRLFGDPEAAARPLELASARLAARNTPFRDEIARALALERDALLRTPPLDRPALIDALQRIAIAVHAMPTTLAVASADAPAADGGWWARLRARLARYVIVERRTTSGAPSIGTAAATPRLSALTALEQTRIALATGDRRALAAALAELRAALAEPAMALSDSAALIAQLDAAAPPHASDPPELGSTRALLATLRAERAPIDPGEAVERDARNDLDDADAGRGNNVDDRARLSPGGNTAPR